MKERLNNMMVAPACVGLGITHIWLVVVLFMLSTYMTLVRSPAAFVLLVIVLDHIFLNWKTDRGKQFMYLCLCTTWALGNICCFPLLFNICVMYDQKRIRFDCVNNLIETCLNGIASIDAPFTFPFTGTNTYVDFSTFFPDWAKGVLDIGYETSVVRLRDLNVSNAPLALSDKPDLSADEVVGRYDELSMRARWLIYLVCATVAFACVGILPAICILMVPILPGLLETSTPVELRPSNKAPNLEDGVYKVSAKLFNTEFSYGIGVVSGGVMHVPFHVTQAADIVLNSRVIRPYYINVGQDLVTYCGPPQFTTIEDGDEVYVNTETVSTRTSYKLENYDSTLSHTTLSWPGVTRPGESGSPVLAVRKEGDVEKVLLVGQAGRYVRSEAGKITEFSNTTGFLSHTPATDAAESETLCSEMVLYKRVIVHPGGGKTRNHIPQEITRLLKTNAIGRILVAGPTRVVCEEMHVALKDKFNVSLNIQDSRYRNPSCKVQIAPHAVAVTMLSEGAIELRNLQAIIIDEAHVDDSATIMLRELAKYQMETKKIEVIEMSATLDGEIANGSNYPISDYELKNEDEATSIVQEELENSKRVLVFIPGVEGKVSKELVKRFKDYDPVILSRKTFAEGMKGVKDLGKKLILSTDIAECGINIPDLDVVVDFGLKVGFELNGGMVSRTRYPANEASIVQRRGRVGRVKMGNYYRIRRSGTQPALTAAAFDAVVLSTGRPWSNAGNAWGIQLSEKQFRENMSKDNDECPLQTYLCRDQNGKKYGGTTLRQRILRERQGCLEIRECQDRTERCKCLGKWKKFDERMHDWLIAQ